MNFWHYILIVLLCFVYVGIIVHAINHRSYLFKLITLKNGNNIEPKLRILMRKNPHHEFVVLDKTNSPETHTILEMMEYDFPELHIIRY